MRYLQELIYIVQESYVVTFPTDYFIPMKLNSRIDKTLGYHL